VSEGLEVDKRFRILQAQCESSGANPFGQLDEGMIEVRGACALPTSFLDIEAEDPLTCHLHFKIGDPSNQHSGFLRVSGDVALASVNGIVSPDGILVPLYCLLVGTDRFGGAGLVLKSSTKAHGKYERVGVFQSLRSSRFLPFDNSMEMNFVIV
jgi:hypothetical protein